MKPFTLRTGERTSRSRAQRQPSPRPSSSPAAPISRSDEAEIETPAHLVDISRLPLADIEETADGGLRIGARVTNSALAADMRVRRRYPLLSQAMLAGASGQLRNKATTGGNLLQRTRCPYFYDTTKPCNKRVPGSGCAAIGGLNRMHASWARATHCIATHPVRHGRRDDRAGCARSRLLAARWCESHDCDRRDFYRLPGDTPHIETVLAPGEMIRSVRAAAAARRAGRSIARCATALPSRSPWFRSRPSSARDQERVRAARVAFGGLSYKPWRSADAEAALVGSAVKQTSFDEAGAAALRNARGYGHNDFKIPLAGRTLRATLADAAGII